MPLMVILVGPPGSGKSTYRNEVMHQATDDFVTGKTDVVSWTYINYDEYREQNPDMPEREVLQLARNEAHAMMSNGYNIIIDNTNINPRAVESWVNLAKHHNYQWHIKEFWDLTWEECYERVVNRHKQGGRFVPRSVIMKMYMQAGKFVDFRRKVVIIDLDGTLCDIEHRREHVATRPKNWGAFFAGIKDDLPVPSVKLFYDMLQAYNGAIADDYDRVDQELGYEPDELHIIFLSGRGEEHRKATEQWLWDHGFRWYHALFMRNYNDRRDDAIVKRELAELCVLPYYDVQVVLDDRTRVVDMWRELGLPCWQVAPGDF